MNKVDNDVTMNMADYFRTQSNIGSATVYNLRTGEKTIVPWGSLDWIGAITGAVFSTAVLGGVGYFIVKFALKLSNF